MPMNWGTAAKWLDRLENRVGRPAALAAKLAALAGIVTSIWLLIATLVGVESALLLRALFSGILLFIILYFAAVFLTIREALYWHKRSGPTQRRLLSTAFLVAIAAILFSAYGDLRARMRDTLVTKEVARIRAYGCTGDYESSLRSIERLANSRRFNFLKSDFQSLSNHERFLAYFRSALRPEADGVALAERRMLFGIPHSGAKPPDVSADLWRRWNAALRDECR